nr:hypothetical protein [Tanacetum cinerariifolium]
MGPDKAKTNAPPKVLRKDHVASHPPQSSLEGKSLASMGIGTGTTVSAPATQEIHVHTEGMSDPDPLSYVKPQPAPKQDVSQKAVVTKDLDYEKSTSFTSMVGSPRSIYQSGWGVTNNYHLDTSAACQDMLDPIVPPGYFSKLRHLPNNEFLNQYNTTLARLDALSIDFDEELYPHILTVIANGRWIIRHDLRLAVMKYSESTELRLVFADVISARIAKGMSEGLKHGVEHGKAKVDLAAIEVYDPEADTKYVAALHALKDLKDNHECEEGLPQHAVEGRPLIVTWVEGSAPYDGVSGTHQPITLKYIPARVGVTNNCRLDTLAMCQDMVDHIVPPGYFSKLRHLPNDEFLNQYNTILARQVAVGSQLRLRFEQETKLLKKVVAQVARWDKRIEAREKYIRNVEALLEAEVGMKGATEAKNVELAKELESLRAHIMGEERIKAAFEEFKKYEDGRVSSRCAEMDARLDVLSIDFDEELYPHMLTVIVGGRWIIRHGLHLAVMKCAESTELRQVFTDVVYARIAKGMSEGLKHGVENGKDKVDLATIKAYDPEADTKYVTALHALKDLKSDGILVSVPAVASQGLAILLADAATQTEIIEDEASPRLIKSKSLPPLYDLDWP